MKLTHHFDVYLTIDGRFRSRWQVEATNPKEACEKAAEKRRQFVDGIGLPQIRKPRRKTAA